MCVFGKNILVAFLILALMPVSALAADLKWQKPGDKLVRASVPGFDCSKRYCKRMKSCAEACYKLTQCGHRRLDRDKDGIPCENICSKVCGR